MAAKKPDPYETRRKIKELAPGVAEGIKAAVAQARNETEFRANSCKVIADAGEEIGITLQLALEYHVAESGFVDALYNRFVIEYERPGTMTARPGAKNAEALGQVKRYVEGLAAAEKRGRHRYAGVATDGKVEYDEKNEDVIFDAKKPPKEQVRVGPVPKHVWEFHVGGYQVLEKWLNDRKGRPVDLGDYVPIIVALAETDRIMKEEIDPAFKEMLGIT